MPSPILIQGVYFYRQRVPADVAAKTGRQFVKRSLKTRDPSEAKARFPAMAAEFQAYFEEVRRGVQTLTPEQCEMIAGEVYGDLIKIGGGGKAAHPIHTASWEGFVAGCKAGLEKSVDMGQGRTMSRLEFLAWHHGTRLDEHLAAKGMVVCDQTYRIMLFALNRAAIQAGEVVLRQVEGDYTPDPLADRFPKPTPPKEKVPFEKLWELKNKGRDPFSTRKLRRFMDALIEHVGTDDMAAVTEDHLLSWRDKLQANPKLSQVTIRDGYFANVKAFFKWAKRQKNLPTDPTADIFIEVSARDSKKMRGFTAEEAELILSAALAPFSPLISPHMRNARKWVPWICAYTGARLNEITQLRGMDIMMGEGIWCIDITPEAGRLKNDQSKRTIPIHSHLIEMGFLEFAKTRPGTKRLFYSEGKTKAESPAANVGIDLAEWVRGLGIKDKETAPFHAWRHRFKTEGAFALMEEAKLDAIQGHAPLTIGRKYNAFPPRMLKPQIERYPRYVVEPAKSVDGRRRRKSKTNEDQVEST